MEKPDVIFCNMFLMKVALACIIWDQYYKQSQLAIQMSEFPLDLHTIEDEATAQTIVQIFLEQSIDEKGVKKDSINKFFDSLLHNLENKSVSPKTKFYSVFILKELSMKEKISAKIFGPFAQHLLYHYLEDLAFNVDPKKNLSDKGKSLFPNDKNTGNDFMRLILESFVAWGGRFPTNSKKQATKFQKTLNRLTEEKIVLPKEFMFYTVASNKRVQSKETPQASSLKGKQKTQKDILPQKATPLPPKPKESKQKYMIELKYMQNKIEQLLGIIDDGQQEQIRREVLSFHLKFGKDRQKLNEYQSFIFQLNSEQIVNKYLNVNAFLQEQQIIYNKHILKDDYSSYISAYLMNFQREFQSVANNNKKKSSLKPNQNQISIDKNIDKSKLSVPPNPKNATSQNLNIQSRASVTKSMHPSEVPMNKEKKIEGNQGMDKQNRHVTESFFSRISKSPKPLYEGFHSIAKSLQKSKINTIAPRLKSSHANTSHLNKTKTLHGSSFNRSRFQLKGIFANPPNANVRIKTYQGQLVIQNIQLQKQCENVHKKQGSRRFKASLFKSKYIVYQDQFIQIGFKSTPIYQKIEKFTSFIDFQLFFGNKTNHNITKFDIFFQGDKRSLIYTNPQRIQHIINPQQQIKMELLNVPKTFPFGFISLAASYEILGDSFNLIALLPNSILQMTTYYDFQPSKIASKWKQCSNILKTEPFKLSRHFPPDQIVNFLPKLKQSIPYSIFSEQGSTTDYELFCEIVIQESFESILKIIIRPDLNVILQLGIYLVQQKAMQSCKFYLQSLMAALKECQA